MDLRNQILQAKDLTNKPVDVPEWGIKEGQLFIKGLSLEDRAEWEATRAKAFEELGEVEFEKRVKALLLIHLLVDAEGKRVFADEDVEPLMKKNNHIVERLFYTAIQWTGFVGTDQAVEAAEKNSESEPTS